MCVLADRIGQNMLADAKLEQEHAIAAETEAVCAHLGRPRGKDGFSDCMLELDGVRQHERARIALEESGPPVARTPTSEGEADARQEDAFR